MPCERVEFEHNGTKGLAIICSRGRRKKCSAAFCDDDATKLCDAPVSGKKRSNTCDRALCDRHASTQGPDLDFCPAHARATEPVASDRLPVAADPQNGTATGSSKGGSAARGDARAENPSPLCTHGDAAAAIANLERTLPKHEAGSFVTRHRTDVFDTEAVDFVLERADFKPRDYADWQEFVAERAAMFEFLGEQPRAIADAKAHQLAGPPPRYAKNGPLFAGAR